MIQNRIDKITKWEHSGKLIIVQLRKSTTDIFRQALLLQRGVVGYFGDLIRLIRILTTYGSILDSFEIRVH